MKALFAALPLLLLGAAVAQEPSPEGPPLHGFIHWPAAKLKAYPAVLGSREPTVRGDTKTMMALERLGHGKNYNFTVERRDVDGMPETHAALDDVFTVLDGEATILYGGKVEGGRELRPGEMRGGKIVGGTSQKMVAGDMAIMPAGVPHQTIVDKGKSYTFMVIKIEQK
jgi:mannose-6-phosphate isomerase-like protein (cupin superfamily)